MELYMKTRAIQRPAEAHWPVAFSKINSEYRSAQADFFKNILMFDLGGVYLDLRGEISADHIDDSLDCILRLIDKHGFAGFCACQSGGHKKEISGGKYAGEIMGGFRMSSPRHAVWQAVLDHTVAYFRCYNSMWHMNNRYDCTTYARKVEPWGRDGCLALGPFCMTVAINEFLDKNSLKKSSFLLKTLDQILYWNKFNGNKPWHSKQAALFWSSGEDQQRHQHYSKLQSRILIPWIDLETTMPTIATGSDGLHLVASVAPVTLSSPSVSELVNDVVGPPNLETGMPTDIQIPKAGGNSDNSHLAIASALGI